MLVFLIFFYFVSGSSPLTYNGFNSSSTVRVRNATSDRLSFAIRTVQVEGLILATRRSATEYVAVGIKDGNLVLRGKVANVSHVITGECSFFVMCLHHILVL